MNTDPPAMPVVEAVGKLVKSDKLFWKDLRERAFSAFWQGAVPVILAAPPVTNWSEFRVVGWAVVMGGCGAVLSAGKSLLSRYRGIENSASSNKKV